MCNICIFSVVNRLSLQENVHYFTICNYLFTSQRRCLGVFRRVQSYWHWGVVGGRPADYHHTEGTTAEGRQLSVFCGLCLQSLTWKNNNMWIYTAHNVSKQAESEAPANYTTIPVSTLLTFARWRHLNGRHLIPARCQSHRVNKCIFTPTAIRRGFELYECLKPGFHYPSWRPELTGDRFPLPVLTGARFH